MATPTRRLLATVALAVACCAPGVPASDGAELFEVPRQDASWARLCEVFDPRWTLPEPPGSARDVDLVRRATTLAAERWAEDGPLALRSLGDLASAAATRGTRGRAGLLAQLRDANPRVWERWGDLLVELFLDDGLRDPEWRGEDDAARDGIAMGEAWTIPEDAGAPWNRIEGNREVQQAMALVWSDLHALKQAENDYATYPGYAGAEYEAIFPVEGSHVRAAPGEDASAQVALQIEFRVDLPFPFSDCTCRLRIRNRLDDDGRLITDVASTSDDYLWLAGRDVFVPLTTSAGDPAALLAVRWFGFDVADVPDGDGTRRAGLRGGLGRLKRRAEEQQASREGGLGPVDGVIPDFDVRGDGRWRR